MKKGGYFLRFSAKDEGLTLIELLAVIVILAVIAAIAIPVILNAITNAKISATESDLSILRSAMKRYYFDHNSYPQTLGQLGETTTESGTTGAGASYGPYLNASFPVRDGFGQPIYYFPNVDPSKKQQETGYYLVSTGTSSTPVTASQTTMQVGNYYLSDGSGTEGGTTITLVMPTLFTSSATAIPLTYGSDS